MRFNWIIFFLIVAVAVSSCREETYEPPFIQMYSPSENSAATTGDTLQVSGSISSAVPITYVKIVLLTTAYVQACPAVTINPGTENYSINTEYIISNTSLLSGTHYLYIEAGNGYSASTKFIRLTVTGIPKESRSLVVFCHEKANDNVKIYKVDSLLNYSLFKQLPDDFQEGAVNSQNQLIYSMGQYKGNLYFLDAANGSVVDQVNALNNPPFPYFESLYWGNNLLIVGYYDGRIEGYFGNGNLKFVYTFDNYRLHQVSYDGIYLLSVLEYFNGSMFFTGAIYEYSGLLKDMVYGTYKVQNLFRVSGNDVVLFCNEGTQPSVRTLNTYSMVITHLKNLPAGEIYGVSQIDYDRHLISHSDGLFVYSFDDNTYAEIGNATTFGDVVYDETDDVLYLSSGKNINAYSYPTGSLIGTVALPDSIKDIKILYNR
ncbi:MAG: hypothetical protein A2W93_10545 [Bacteroidetes bacterium GWF2_43_63]|nr:MAG: hypothetical protein A2W94_01925 [Bacteroidetes bacterium GWE2_42_42]OFY52957.1 MAG: hypothetical protein A2W93_10545 [Bacteroidetes bacterium GWF2_43_63]HBG70167.1 hypothetical protein [Bacteroidales bacterium]HCB62226.1 hypothetical protein [Bacteroidales bacterium]